MPFAGFKDFADCVSKSGEKDNPQAYCAAVHKQATGKFPTENQEQMEGSQAIINLTETEFQALIANYKEPDIKTYFQDTPTRIIRGVEIFKTGLHQDSLGREREWTSGELGSIIKAFSSGRPSMVPVKLGHTSAEHNEKVAKELGIPSSILSGEGSNGHGAANLGRLLKVYRSNGTLIADLEVPEKVATLVESGLFSNVSSELNENYQDLGPAISGLALLGSERPALKGLKGLSDAQILAEEKNPSLVYVFSMGDKLEFVRDKPKPKRKKATGKYLEMVDKLHHFIFGSGRAKPTPELIYQVPVTEEHTDESGQTTRRVVVQHVRASTISEARGVAFSALQSVLGGFGKVIAAGVGTLVVTLVAERLGLIPKVRYDVGNPTVIRNPTGDQKRKAKDPVKSLTRTIAGDKFRIFSEKADGLYNYNLATGLAAIDRFKAFFKVVLRNPVTAEMFEFETLGGTSKEAVEETIKRVIAFNPGNKGNLVTVSVTQIIEGVGKIFNDRADALHNYNLLAGLQLGAAVVTKLPLMIIGAVTLKNVAFDTIAEDKEQNQQRPVRVWVETEAQVEPAVKKTLGPSWGVIGKVVAATGLKTISDKATLSGLGFSEVVDDLHSFSALDTVRDWLQDKGFITTMLNLPDEDLDRISHEISHVHPELQPVVVRQNLEMLKQDARATPLARMEPDIPQVLPFPEFTGSLHNFVSLKAIKTSTQQGVSEEFVNYSLRDRDTGAEIGSAMVTHFPEVKELVIDWIQGAIGVTGVSQFLRQIKTDFPDVSRVIGDRASGANPGRLLSLSLGRFDEMADALHNFHTVHPITRRRLRPHSHRGEQVSGALGTAKGTLQNPRIRKVSRRLARLAIRRRFQELEKIADALKSKP